ncbi:MULTISPECIES: 50S ribosomal protein L9 [Selenomonas]|uniref:Large ribosomal subunit protein bL9 n=1 Tax=Selenomonas sputigena (strain ATCC 35185 / DSM 20758 / CCUG 44933 / VPI D19B-28) TaxID=546271 RepID=C9LYM3_SELS3|nr:MULTISPECIES: 50S ribosomal protein L9 [Selenomonas]AEC00999.1 ribosomal protein L9 [Selenomonas sputigena ATCC 35185]EEX75973.1 ribosomal protein L9 [Selenomonas sputigena ATCC 35185]UZD42843.1 50S ribosomal protein L9 [Selenomonas sputigena]
MKVILQQDVKKVGSKGDIVEVSEGYGRNFLLPKKLAVEATAANLETAKQKANSAARKKQQATDEARLLAAQLEKVSVKVAVRIGEGGKLFGSVTGKDVADALAKEHGIDVDRRKISLKSEVTGAGEYEAVIKVHPEIQSTIRVLVVAE